MFKKLNKKGFTLAELLVVVAIIGVLVAISIPIFTSQLEKSREAVDIANLRSAKAEAVAAYLSSDTIDGTKLGDGQTAKKQVGYDSKSGKLVAVADADGCMKGTTATGNGYTGTDNEYGYTSTTDYATHKILVTIDTDGSLTWDISTK